VHLHLFSIGLKRRTGDVPSKRAKNDKKYLVVGFGRKP
jgi:hypothetical protein